MSVSQITPTLFLSGADAPLNQALVSRKGITLIVNATLNHVCPVYPGVECLRVPVSDLPSARLGDHFERVAERIHSNRTGGTLVHCAAGMSRSPALVIAYLMRYRGVTLCRAHAWVQESRPYVRLNAGFWAQLLEFEKRLYGKNTVKVAAPMPPVKPPLSPWTLRSSWTQRSPPLLPRSPLLSSLSQAKKLKKDDPAFTSGDVIQQAGTCTTSEVRRTKRKRKAPDTPSTMAAIADTQKKQFEEFMKLETDRLLSELADQLVAWTANEKNSERQLQQ